MMLGLMLHKKVHPQEVVAEKPADDEQEIKPAADDDEQEIKPA
jgi:hypothetical protein